MMGVVSWAAGLAGSCRKKKDKRGRRVHILSSNSRIRGRGEGFTHFRLSTRLFDFKSPPQHIFNFLFKTAITVNPIPLNCLSDAVPFILGDTFMKPSLVPLLPLRP